MIQSPPQQAEFSPMFGDFATRFSSQSLREEKLCIKRDDTTSTLILFTSWLKSNVRWFYNLGYLQCLRGHHRYRQRKSDDTISTLTSWCMVISRSDFLQKRFGWREHDGHRRLFFFFLDSCFSEFRFSFFLSRRNRFLATSSSSSLSETSSFFCFFLLSCGGGKEGPATGRVVVVIRASQSSLRRTSASVWALYGPGSSIRDPTAPRPLFTLFA